MAQQKAERLLCKRQAATGQGCRGSPASFSRWRDHNNDDHNDGDTDEDSGAARQGGYAYEVVV